jgi:hypothetical protein
MDESAVAMPARNQALLNATLVASTAATVDLDSLYVNSVVHSIRAEGMGGAARGKLWESLHRALLGIRTSKAALQAVASAGGAALGGDVLKEETRELFHSLRDECANFGTWDNRASAAGGGEVPALSPRSALMSATSLPAIVPSPVHDNSSSNNNNSDFDRLDPSATTSEDVLNSVLGTTSPKLKRSAAVNLDQPQVHSWSSSERRTLAGQLLHALRDLGVLKASAPPSVERRLRKFLANLALMSIEPCDRPCLGAQDVSNLLIESILTNSRSLPLDFGELDRLSEWRTSRVTWMAIRDVLTEWTRNRGKRQRTEGGGRHDRDAFYLESDALDRRSRRRQRRQRSRRRGRDGGGQDLQVWFCCAPTYDEQDLQKSLQERKLRGEMDLAETVQNAEAAADALLHRLAMSAVTLSPIQAKMSRDMVKTRGWQMEVF